MDSSITTNQSVAVAVSTKVPKTDGTGRCLFLELPLEIRLMIYGFLKPHDNYRVGVRFMSSGWQRESGYEFAKIFDQAHQYSRSTWPAAPVLPKRSWFSLTALAGSSRLFYNDCKNLRLIRPSMRVRITAPTVYRSSSKVKGNLPYDGTTWLEHLELIIEVVSSYQHGFARLMKQLDHGIRLKSFSVAMQDSEQRSYFPLSDQTIRENTKQIVECWKELQCSFHIKAMLKAQWGSLANNMKEPLCLIMDAERDRIRVMKLLSPTERRQLTARISSQKKRMRTHGSFTATSCRHHLKQDFVTADKEKWRK